jgi:hypothetical protein
MTVLPVGSPSGGCTTMEDRFEIARRVKKVVTGMLAAA